MENGNSYWDGFWKRRLSRRRMLQGVALGGAGLAAAAVIGCDEEEGGEPAAQQPGAPEQPRQGGVLTWVSQANETANTLDIHKIGHTTMYRAGMVYNKLVRHDMSKYPQEFAFIPELAESWEIPNPTTYVVKLRRGVKFANIAPVSGRELKAADVTFSFQRQIDEKANASVWASVDKFEAVDDYTVRFTLKRPDADFFFALSDPRSLVMPREPVDAAGGDLSSGPVIGTGPWIMKEWIHDQILKHQRKPDYFLGPLPYADEFHLVTIPDAQTSQAAFRTGQVLNLSTNDQVTQLLKASVPNLQIVNAQLLGAASGDRLWMNPTKPPTNDVRVRQALGMLFDRPNIIKTIVFGDGWVTSGIFMPALDWHLTEAEMSQWLAFDVQKARQLFQAAGFDPRSWKPTLDAGIPSATGGTVPDAEAYVSNLRQVGIEAKIQIVDKTEIVDQVWRQARTDFCVCNKPTFSGSNGELYVFYHSRGNLAEPYKLLADAQLDSIIDKQAAELDAEKRKAILKDVQRRVLETAVAVPIFSRLNNEAIQPKVRGYKNDTQDPHRYTEVWLTA